MLGRMSFMVFESGRLGDTDIPPPMQHRAAGGAGAHRDPGHRVYRMSWLIVRTGSRYRYVLEFGACLPQALPEVILARRRACWNVNCSCSRDVVPLYGNGVAFRHRQQGAGAEPSPLAQVNSSLLQIHKELEEAAVHRGSVPGADFLAYPRDAAAPYHHVGVDLVRDPGVAGSSPWRWTSSRHGATSRMPSGDLELLELERHERGGRGHPGNDRRADAAYPGVQIVRPALAHAGIVTPPRPSEPVA